MKCAVWPIESGDAAWLVRVVSCTLPVFTVANVQSFLSQYPYGYVEVPEQVVQYSLFIRAGNGLGFDLTLNES